MPAGSALRLSPSPRSMQQAMMALAAEKGLAKWVATLTQRLDMMQAKTTSTLAS